MRRVGGGGGRGSAGGDRRLDGAHRPPWKARAGSSTWQLGVLSSWARRAVGEKGGCDEGGRGRAQVHLRDSLLAQLVVIHKDEAHTSVVTRGVDNRTPDLARLRSEHTEMGSVQAFVTYRQWHARTVERALRCLIPELPVADPAPNVLASVGQMSERSPPTSGHTRRWCGRRAGGRAPATRASAAAGRA
eukprot:6195976-Pleurochrysis_carterae.AAC.4